MKLEKFKKSSQKQRKVVITTIMIVILLVASFVLYRTYAYYEESKTYNVLQGKIGDFGYDIKLAVTLDGVKQDSVPARGLYKTEISCKDRDGNQVSTGTWDYNNWSLTVENLQYETKCNVAFTSNLTQEEYNKYIDAGIALRRNTYRGKDITSYYTDGSLYTMISNGTFDDIYVGDYFTAEYAGTATIFLVADIDNYLGTGSTSSNCKIVNEDITNTENCIFLKKHHITVIPAKTLLSAKMNETNTTEGGYVSTEMVTSTLATVETNLKITFGSHLLQYSNLLTTAIDVTRTGAGLGLLNSGASSDFSWYLRYVDLMSEMNLYGGSVWSSSAYDIGLDKNQYAIFRLKPEFINGYSGVYLWYWLKDVSGSTSFAVIGGEGGPGSYSASIKDGVRPRFLIG